MKVILIDDEELVLDYFEHLLKSVSDFNIIGKYTNPLEGKKAIEEQEVDLVFLDIQTPEINGIELAEQLLEKNPSLPIVFVTAYDEYAIKAFELNALDYVLKPVSKERLLKTVQRIEEKLKEDPPNNEQNNGNLELQLFQQVTLSRKSEEKLTIIPLKWRTMKVQQIFLKRIFHVFILYSF